MNKRKRWKVYTLLGNGWVSWNTVGMFVGGWMLLRTREIVEEEG